MTEQEMKTELAREIELRDWAQAVLDSHIRKVATLELDLVAAEKPELRHGDYGIDEYGPFFLWENRYLWTKEYGPDNDKCISRSLNKTGNDSQLGLWVLQIRGNIFDDLKALSKRLFYFKADVHEYSFDFVGHTGAPVKIAGNWHTLTEAKQISQDLQRLVRTAGMEEPK